MKIALAQINTTIGDFDGNVDLIVNAAHKARDYGAELCLFPEQCIPGYPAHDFLERTRFIDQNLMALDQVVRSVQGIGVIVGFAERHKNGVGKGLYNSAALIENGRIVSIHRKSLLPVYDIFDESRYFDPAPSIDVVEFHGMRLGVTICEDVWNDPDFWKHRLYSIDPAKELIEKGAEIIINIAASPFTITKRLMRSDMLKALAEHHKTPLLFVNSIGGNDELVFDGASMAFGSDGRLWEQGKEFEEDLVIVDTDCSMMDEKAASSNDYYGVRKPCLRDFTQDIVAAEGASMAGPLHSNEDEAALEALILGVKDYARKCGFKMGLVGLSGGIDSALVAVIGARAFGSGNMKALLMPSRYSSEGSITDSEQLARNLGIKYHLIPIHDTLDKYLQALEPVLGCGNLDLTEESLQARIRGNLLMAVSNRNGNLLLSTGNKSELATGYCTLYGDMAGGLAVISDVPKTMVYRLCSLINRKKKIIPQAILDKPPSAELKPDQRDSDSLPPYDILDRVLESHIVDGNDYPALIKDGFDPDLVDSILKMVRNSEYKRRQAPPGIKLTTKAFGYGRRMPMAQRWQP